MNKQYTYKTPCCGEIINPHNGDYIYVCISCKNLYKLNQLVKEETKPSTIEQDCGYCKKVQNNRGGNLAYNCKRHKKTTKFSKIKYELLTDEKVKEIRTKLIDETVGVVEEHIECTCDEVYRNRRITDPNCWKCNNIEELKTKLIELKNK